MPQHSKDVLVSQVLISWNRSNNSIISDLSTNGWLLSVDTNLRKDVQNKFNGPRTDSSEKVIAKLYVNDVDSDILTTFIVSGTNLNNFKVIQSFK